MRVAFNSVHSSSFFKKSAVATVGKRKSRQTQVGCPESSRIDLPSTGSFVGGVMNTLTKTPLDVYTLD